MTSAGVRVVRQRDGSPTLAGITPEDRERVFEPFERARTGVHGPDSIGVGLPVSRTLARLMSGDLIYERVAEESVFELSLPLLAADGDESGMQGRSKSHPGQVGLLNDRT